VAINCAAVPENLLASELFGHEKGAFTGATSDRAGAFERASGGTLLLDEIGDIPPSTQIHLLRVIESREVIRVGGSRPVPVRPRLVAATHRDLDELVRAGAFREDLYFRINVFRVQIPPLRDRPADIPDLVKHFLAELGETGDRIPEPAMPPLLEYAWPGNVRELRNVVENLVIRSKGNPVTEDMIQAMLEPLMRAGTRRAAEGETLAEMEIRKIQDALREAGGNKSKAAAALGISRRKLYSRMNVLGIEDGMPPA
jgi:two-component system NtrC family response regulator